MKFAPVAEGQGQESEWSRGESGAGERVEQEREWSRGESGAGERRGRQT